MTADARPSRGPLTPAVHRLGRDGWVSWVTRCDGSTAPGVVAAATEDGCLPSEDAPAGHVFPPRVADRLRARPGAVPAPGGRSPGHRRPPRQPPAGRRHRSRHRRRRGRHRDVRRDRRRRRHRRPALTRVAAWPRPAPRFEAMPASAPTIVATSMGFASRGRGPYDWRPGPVFDLMTHLAGGPERPRLCYLGTATGDDAARVAAFYGAFAGSAVRASHLSLFPMPTVADIREHLLAQDVVWVGGGSVANLLAVWRAHGVDGGFAAAWRAGVVLGGVSAGSLCWHVGGTTDSFGPDLRPVTNGLGLIATSNGVHYDSEEQRRPLYHRLVADGTLPGGHATDDGVGLVYRGTELVEAVADRPGKAAYRVERGPDGDAGETRLEPRLLR